MIVSKFGMELIQFERLLQMPSKATFAKPHHSTSGIPEVVAQWIVGATLLLGLYIVFRVWLSLKNEPKNPPKKRQS